MNQSLLHSSNFKWLITAMLSLLCLAVPEQGFITYEVKFFFAITVFGLALAAFELIPIFAIGIIMPVLWIIFKVAPVETVMSAWTGTTVLMLIGSYFLGATLEDSGLLRRIAFFVMSKTKGSYFVLLLGLMLVSVLLNILAMGWGFLISAPLAYGLYRSLNTQDNHVAMGIAAAAMLGGCTAHSYTWQATNWAILMDAGADYLVPGSLSPLTLLLHCWPLFFNSILILYITAKIWKPKEDLGDVSYFQEQLIKLGKFTRREKVNCFMMIFLLIYAFTTNIHGLDLNLGFAIIPWIVYLPFMNGADDHTMRKINWQMIFFVVTCLSIGSVAGSLGLGDVIAAACKTALHGSTNFVAILFTVFLIVFVLNFLMTPVAIFALIMSPMLLLATELGFDPVVFAYAINASSEAIIFPYEYVPYLVAYSFGIINMKDFIKWNILRSIIFFLGIFTILIGYWKIIGLL